MRVQARDEGIPAPDFVHASVTTICVNLWGVCRGRGCSSRGFEAGSMGIRKVNRADELWPMLEELGDRQTFYVLRTIRAGRRFSC